MAIARALSDTFAGIRSVDAPMFIIAELGGAAFAVAFLGWLVVADDDPAKLNKE